MDNDCDPSLHEGIMKKLESKTLTDYNKDVERVREARGRGLSPQGLADALDITDDAYDAERKRRIAAEGEVMVIDQEFIEMKADRDDIAKKLGSHIIEIEKERDAEREARVKAEEWARYWHVRDSQELKDHAEIMYERAAKIERCPPMGDKEPTDE